MKKLFAVLALVGIITSCNNKKKDEKKPEGTTTTTPTTTTPTETTPAISGVPTFSDTEVQKFVNEYSAFAKEFRTASADPAKAAELAKTAQAFSEKMGTMIMKIVKNPEELEKWNEWGHWIQNEMMPATK